MGRLEAMIISPSVEMVEADAVLASGLAAVVTSGLAAGLPVVVVVPAQLTQSESKPSVRTDRLNGTFMCETLLKISYLNFFG